MPPFWPWRDVDTEQIPTGLVTMLGLNNVKAVVTSMANNRVVKRVWVAVWNLIVSLNSVLASGWWSVREIIVPTNPQNDITIRWHVEVSSSFSQTQTHLDFWRLAWHFSGVKPLSWLGLWRHANEPPKTHHSFFFFCVFVFLSFCAAPSFSFSLVVWEKRYFQTISKH